MNMKTPEKLIEVALPLEAINKASACPRPTVRVLGFPRNKLRNRGKSVEARIWSHNWNKRPTRVVCDVQAASIPASRGIASREKSAVRPFSIESDPISCLRLPA